MLVTIRHLREALQADMALVWLLSRVLSVVTAQVTSLVEHLVAPLYGAYELLLHALGQLVEIDPHLVLVLWDI